MIYIFEQKYTEVYNRKIIYIYSTGSGCLNCRVYSILFWKIKKSLSLLKFIALIIDLFINKTFIDSKQAHSKYPIHHYFGL